MGTEEKNTPISVSILHLKAGSGLPRGAGRTKNVGSGVHTALQTLPQLLRSQIAEVDHLDIQFRGAVAHAGVAPLGRDDGGAGHLAAETVAQNGKLVERFGLHVAGLAADEQRHDAAAAHDVQLVADGVGLVFPLPVDDHAQLNVVEDARVQAGFIDVELQHAAHVPQPGADLSVAEAEGHALPRRDPQLPDEAQLLKGAQRVLRRVDAGAALALDGVGAGRVQRDGSFGAGRRYALEIGDDPCPVPPEPQKNLEKRIEVRKVERQSGIVHPPLAHGAAGHQEEILDLIAQRAEPPLGKISMADIIKTVLPAAVCEDRDVRLRAEQSGGEQNGVRAAGDVHRAVGIARENGPQQRKHRVGVVDICLEKDKLRPQAAAFEEDPHLLLERGAARNDLRADVHDPLRPEYLRAQDVLQRASVKQLDQRFHGASSILFLYFCPCGPRGAGRHFALFTGMQISLT